ncbi:hypothetical protein AB6A40_008840 [Gnathostoma spinigerum]|uniref:E3 ubiquitin-protein ligase CBL n=1 Tax=Gnathostoma spinigerum TaxID=75299 RepID=A0ABD6EQL3_9BILA
MSGLTSLLNRLHGFVGWNSNSSLLHAQNGRNDTAVAGPSNTVQLQDRKVIDKTFKLMDHVVKQCQQPRLSLKNSPPFILDILPDTYHQLTTIFTKDPNILRDNHYLQTFMDNIQLKCKEVCPATFVIDLPCYHNVAVFSDNNIRCILSAT